MDVVALGELLIDFACLNTDADGYPTMAAHPGRCACKFSGDLDQIRCADSVIGQGGR